MLAAQAKPTTGWPALDRGQDDPICQQALALGKAAFNSPAFYLYAPPPVPAGLASDLLVKPKAVDISAGNGVQVDDSAFSTLSSWNYDTSTPGIYWQKDSSGFRLLLVDRYFNYQGDQYTLYIVPADRPQSAVLADIRTNPGALQSWADGWRPPLILHDRTQGQFWLIDFDTAVLGSWNVAALTQHGVEPRCTVQFFPPAHSAAQLLPANVLKLVRLLSQAQGKDGDDGTMREIARLQFLVDNMLGNAALRPWAIIPIGNDRPYNSHAEIDAGLKGWAAQGPSNHKLYLQIQRQYPLAVAALDDYYRTVFYTPPDQALSHAKRVIDLVYRSGFIFSHSTH